MGWTGSAPSQSFERTDGTRTGSQTWQEAAAASVDILSTDHDTHDQDLADGINSCLKKDGGNTATNNIPMGGFKFTNVGDATTTNEYMTLSQHLAQAGHYSTVGGTADVITLTTGFSLSAYAEGQTFSFIPALTNTSTTVTVNVDGLGALGVKVAGSDPEIGQIVQNTVVTVVHDGTDFELQNTSAAPAKVGVGSIMAFAGSTVPMGSLECDGSAVSRTTYADLFAAVGTLYGVGDGSTTFNLPDLTGRTVFGEEAVATRLTSGGGGIDGSVLGDTGGNETVTLVEGNLPAHTHTGTTDGHDHDYTRYSSQDDFGGGSAFTNIWRNSSTQQTSTETDTFTTDSSGSGTAFSIMPPAIVLKWIIIASAGVDGGCFGKQETWIGAGKMIARSDSPPLASTFEQGSGDFITLTTWDFDTTSDEFVSFEWTPPKRWDAGTVTFIPYWTNAAGLTTETASFQFAGAAISDNDALGATLGTAVTSTDTWLAQNDLHIGPETAACTIGGTPADADFIAFSINRDTSVDNMTGDVKLLGVKLIWTSEAGSDA